MRCELVPVQALDWQAGQPRPPFRPPAPRAALEAQVFRTVAGGSAAEGSAPGARLALGWACSRLWLAR